MFRVAMFLLPVALAKKPNLVMMVIDDVGWADVGYHGSNFSTPNIDRLATEGLQLERYYVQQVCSPTRSALITARYPHHTGMQHCTTVAPASRAALPMHMPTIAESLRAVGYTTAAIGKWHLGGASWDNTPLGRGFDSFAGFLQGKSDYYNRTIFGGVDVWRNKTVAWEEIGKYSVDMYEREAQRVLDQRDPAKPFFLYYAHQSIHLPLESPPGQEHAEACSNEEAFLPSGHNRNVLCQMMHRMDKAIGAFVDLLKSRLLWEDTLVWVTSDNGGLPGGGLVGEGAAASNYPFRGGKATLFEGGVRVVSFVTGGLLPPQAAGKKYHGLLQHVDIPTTMLALAGATSSETDGFNVWEAITHDAPSPRWEAPLNVDVSGLAHYCATYMHNVSADPEEALLNGEVPPLTDYDVVIRQNFSALIQGNWKLINGHRGMYDGYWSNDPYLHTDAPSDSAQVGGEQVWLFNLAEDPEERQNLANSNTPVVLRMQARLRELRDPTRGYRGPQSNVPHIRGLPKYNNGTWAPWIPSARSEIIV